jgi:hypothetical protein
VGFPQRGVRPESETGSARPVPRSCQFPGGFELPPRRLALRAEDLKRAISIEEPRVRGPRGRRAALLGLAAAVLLLGGAAATARVLQGEPQSPPGLEEAITALFPPDQCVTPAAGQRLVRAELDRLGFAEWTVQTNRTNPNEPCVIAGFAPGERSVILVRMTDPAIAKALQAVDQRLWSECFNEQQARELIGQELTRLEVRDWSIEVNEGVRPNDEAYTRHLEQGPSFSSAPFMRRTDPPPI